MSDMVPLYGFGGGSGTGATMTVTAPAGCTVTISKDGKSKTKAAGSDGVAVFKGLATGEWTVTITDGKQTAQKTVTVTADYSTAINFFFATIHITYPAGSTCTATDGVTTLTAPDTSGSWACVVPNAGTWVITITDGEEHKSEPVSITSDGQNETLEIDYSIVVLSPTIDNTGGFRYYTSGSGASDVKNGDGSYTLTRSKGAIGGYTHVTNKAYDVTRKTILEVTVSQKGSGNYYAVGMAPEGVSSAINIPLKLDISGKEAGTHLVPIDGISGMYSFAVNLGSDVTHNLTVSKIILR